MVVDNENPNPRHVKIETKNGGQYFCHCLSNLRAQLWRQLYITLSLLTKRLKWQATRQKQCKYISVKVDYGVPFVDYTGCLFVGVFGDGVGLFICFFCLFVGVLVCSFVCLLFFSLYSLLLIDRNIWRKKISSERKTRL